MKRKALGLSLLGAILAVATATALPARRGLSHAVNRTEHNGPRVRVQVLNATRVRGLGRRAMLYLRDQGFDVVEVGTTTLTRDTTLVLDR